MPLAGRADERKDPHNHICSGVDSRLYMAATGLLTHAPVDALPQQIRVSAVARVLLDHVD
jgi:hypothetical protein